MESNRWQIARAILRLPQEDESMAYLGSEIELSILVQLKLDHLVYLVKKPRLKILCIDLLVVVVVVVDS